MATNRSRTRLAVILHADVVGSTALVQIDETTAHDRVQDVFRRFSDTIRAYSGVPHELRGDALVAEFARASDAVLAALAFQAANAEHNLALKDDIRPEIRVGISLGEVVAANGTLTGSDVVLAQRLEQMASSGGVCVSAAVRQAIPVRLPLSYEDLGEHKAKGFDDPVRVYAVDRRTGESIPGPEPVPVIQRWMRHRRGKWVFGGSVLAAISLVVVALAWWQPWLPREESAAADRMAFPLPEKPSLAVLPFTNLTGDPAQEYFSDGITEDLITALSKIPDLFVIARTSTFAYKGTSPTIKQVAEALGVRYVLEGSVQRSGDLVRITAQLIDALGGQHIWAEDYDREIGDLLVLQDDISWQVATELEVELSEGEQARRWRQSTTNPEAYDLFSKGRSLLHSGEPESLHRARELLERAVELDPDFVAGWVKLGWTYHFLAWGSDSPADLQEKAIDCFERAISIDDSFSDAYALRGAIYIDYDGDLGLTIASLEKAIALDPNNATNALLLARQLVKRGDIEKAERLSQRAMRLDPNPPVWALETLGRVHLFAGQCDKAITAYRECVSRQPANWSCQTDLAVAYMAAGREEEGREQAREALKITHEGFSLSKWGGESEEQKRFWEEITRMNAAPDPFAGQCVVDRARRVMFMLKAGLPE